MRTEDGTATAVRGTPASSQPPSSTDAETSQVVPVRETLPPFEDDSQKLVNGNDRDLALTVVGTLYPKGIGKDYPTASHILNALKHNVGPEDQLTASDIADAARRLSRQGLDWTKARVIFKGTPLQIFHAMIHASVNQGSIMVPAQDAGEAH